jgi:hypothetical protein
VTIRYDPVSCQLWLDPVNPDEHNGQFLCRDHAERLSPPRGWVVVDRRGAQTAIRTAAPVATVQRVVPRRTARRRWGSFDEPTLEFTRDDDAHAVPDDVTLLVTPISTEPPPVLVEPLPPAEPAPIAVEPPSIPIDPAPVLVELASIQIEQRPAPVESAPILIEPPPVPPEVGHDVEPEHRDAHVVTDEPGPVEALEVVDEPEVEEPEVEEPEVVEVVAAPSDDLTNLLKPRGGLLGRAFDATGPQRSALTIVDDDAES